MFHIRCISIHKLGYFNFFSASFCTTFLSASIIIIIIIIIIILWALVLIICLICIRASLEKHFHFHRSVAYWLDTKVLSVAERLLVLPRWQETAADRRVLLEQPELLFLMLFCFALLVHIKYTGSKLHSSLYVPNVTLNTQAGANNE